MKNTRAVGIFARGIVFCISKPDTSSRVIPRVYAFSLYELVILPSTVESLLLIQSRSEPLVSAWPVGGSGLKGHQVCWHLEGESC